MKTVTLAFAVALAATGAEGATIRVPADAATIQQAINAAASGDTVLVAPGTYVENLNFLGKAIAVISEGGPLVTVIDGNHAGSVVLFTSGETRAALLRGFTIQNGASSLDGGGIFIRNSSPTITENWILGNGACSGAGIMSRFGSPLIQGNRIARNYLYGCTGGFGLGVYIGGDSQAELIGNSITDNNGMAHGGGLTLFAAGRAVVRGNVIARNLTWGFSPCTQGGGIWMVNFSQVAFTGNLIVANASGCGGGIYWSGSSGVNTFVNNTVADNDAPLGSAIQFSGADSRHLIYNNVLVGKAGQPAVYCDTSSSVPQPVFNTSNVYSRSGPAYAGTCSDQTGLRGNLSVNPMFVQDPFADVLGDYHLQPVSPAVDAGDNSAPQLPAVDLDGAPRVFDGDFDGDPRVDMGAYEFFTANTPPSASAGADQDVSAGASCVTTVTLDGTGSSDPDGDPLTYSWSGSFGSASGATPAVTLPVGSHLVTLTVSDGRGGSSTDTVVVRVSDTTPPVIASATASPSVLPTPNKQMVAVTVTVSASDSCGGSVHCRIVSVTSNEAIDATDAVVTGDLTLNLRAERSNKGNGRVYTITVECVDASGNVSTTTTTVTVPR